MASHSRTPSTRAALPRRATKGPLDAPPDVPAPIATTANPPRGTSVAPSTFVSADHASDQREVREEHEESRGLRPARAAEQPTAEHAEAQAETRDLSFLLDPSIYHALSQSDIPTPFRKPFLPPPASDTPVRASLNQLDNLLSSFDFLRAAHYAASILVSRNVQATDTRTIFKLLEVRYSCLELSANTLMAAQEAKALEDLSSEFYYVEADKGTGDDQIEGQSKKTSKHIMPFALRLQVLRLQSIGFSDSRRGVSSLYDVAWECRAHLSDSELVPEERNIWTQRLQEVSIRVVNALIENGDLDVAVRLLKSLQPSKSEHGDLIFWASRMILLMIKLGNVDLVHDLLADLDFDLEDLPIPHVLTAAAEGRLDEAAKLLSRYSDQPGTAVTPLFKQNLAWALLYRGHVAQAKAILEELVADGHSFQTLTVNLATIHDLTSDKSRERKMELANVLAQTTQTMQDARAGKPSSQRRMMALQDQSSAEIDDDSVRNIYGLPCVKRDTRTVPDLAQPRSFTNADFKL
jgi:trafficking protein particle complex subunit 12